MIIILIVSAFLSVMLFTTISLIKGIINIIIIILRKCGVPIPTRDQYYQYKARQKDLKAAQLQVSSYEYSRMTKNDKYRRMKELNGRI